MDEDKVLNQDSEEISTTEIPVLENPDDREYEVVENQDEEGL